MQFIHRASDSELTLGGSRADSTFSRGSLYITGYGSTYKTRIYNSGNRETLTADRNLYIPDKSGTIAVTDDLATKVSISSLSGNTSPELATGNSWIKTFYFDAGSTYICFRTLNNDPTGISELKVTQDGKLTCDFGTTRVTFNGTVSTRPS